MQDSVQVTNVPVPTSSPHPDDLTLTEDEQSSGQARWLRHLAQHQARAHSDALTRTARARSQGER